MNENIVQIMSQGKQTEFWSCIKDELQRRVLDLTKRIMDNELMDADEEKRLKYKASVYKSLMDLPDRLIKENEISLPLGETADPSQAYD